ncbi:hypothetical protein [Streptomyces decoyicus]|uniref:hypothetical protein n=1 Tax=Streptomyces decoyicus TaxID=249567 RepID=UPI0033AA8282
MKTIVPLRKRGDGHGPAAETLRKFPRRWFLIGTYRAHYSAVSAASSIRSARYAQYGPPGAFESRVEPFGDESGVYARYTGGPR